MCIVIIPYNLKLETWMNIFFALEEGFCISNTSRVTWIAWCFFICEISKLKAFLNILSELKSYPSLLYLLVYLSGKIAIFLKWMQWEINYPKPLRIFWFYASILRVTILVQVTVTSYQEYCSKWGMCFVSHLLPTNPFFTKSFQWLY